MSETATRVALLFVAERLNVYLRFGRPLRERRLDGRRRIVEFAPGATFCRIRWEGDEHGTTRWQLCVLQALGPEEITQRIRGIAPGAALLLHAEGTPAVLSVLRIIDAIEALRVNGADVPVSYWRMVQNRIAARASTPAYTPGRHQANKARQRLG